MGDMPVGYFGRASENLRRHLFARLAGVILLAVALFFSGALTVFSFSLHRLFPIFAFDSKIVAYLHSESTPEDMEALAREVRSWPGVEQVRSVSKEDARDEMERQLGEWSPVMKGFRENPLPSSLEIGLKSGTLRNDEYGLFLEKLGRIPQVEEVMSGRDWTGKLRPLLDKVEFVGWGAAGVFALAALCSMFVTRRSVAEAHRDELEVYRIVGATPFHAFFPFYLEGVVEAGASTVLAAGLLMLCVYGVQSTLPFPISAVFPMKNTEILLAVAGQGGGGVVLAWAAAWLALQRSPTSW